MLGPRCWKLKLKAWGGQGLLAVWSNFHFLFLGDHSHLKRPFSSCIHCVTVHLKYLDTDNAFKTGSNNNVTQAFESFYVQSAKTHIFWSRGYVIGTIITHVTQWGCLLNTRWERSKSRDGKKGGSETLWYTRAGLNYCEHCLVKAIFPWMIRSSILPCSIITVKRRQTLINSVYNKFSTILYTRRFSNEKPCDFVDGPINFTVLPAK